MVPLIHHPDFYLPFGKAHVFPGVKYRLIRERLIATGMATDDSFRVPDRIALDDVLRVHDAGYTDRLINGTLAPAEIRRMELPYSKELVEATLLGCGGTLLAARLALMHGVAISIGGGFHHAHPGHGEGFCMLHDVAIALRRLLQPQHQGDEAIHRALVIDLDVHQGNGTAAIFKPSAVAESGAPSPAANRGPQRTVFVRGGGEAMRWDHGEAAALSATNAGATEPALSLSKGLASETWDHGKAIPTKYATITALNEHLPCGTLIGPGLPSNDGVFTLSLHQRSIYPAYKPPSSIDVHLNDGVEDADYLAALSRALELAFERFTPDLIAYVAGSDPYHDDKLGSLALSVEGLRTRDQMVFAAARARQIPIFSVFAGGYARQLEVTVTIHTNTVLAAKEQSSS